MKYKLSSYTVKVKVKDNYYLYNTITGKYLKLTNFMQKIIDNINDTSSHNKSSSLGKLYKNGFILEKDVDETEEIIDQSRYLRDNNKVLHLTIVLTRKCNFNCSYCFERNENKFLHKDIVPYLENLILTYLEKVPFCNKIVVHWFGGEPLLNIEMMKNISKSIKKIIQAQNYKIEYSSILITNGYILEKIIPIRDELNITDVQITIDGPKTIHDSRRYLLDSGQGTYDKIISNILLLANENVDIIVRMNLDKDNIAYVKTTYDFVKENAKGKKANFYFYPTLVRDYTNGNCDNLHELFRSEALFVDKYREVIRIEHGADAPMFIGSYCDYNFPGSITIDVDGGLYKCWASIGNLSRSFGNIYKSKAPLQTPKYLKIINSAILSTTVCKKCKYLPLCMGGCRFLKKDPEFCNFKRRIFHERISDYIYNDIGNVKNL